MRAEGCRCNGRTARPRLLVPRAGKVRAAAREGCSAGRSHRLAPYPARSARGGLRTRLRRSLSFDGSGRGAQASNGYGQHQKEMFAPHPRYVDAPLGAPVESQECRTASVAGTGAGRGVQPWISVMRSRAICRNAHTNSILTHTRSSTASRAPCATRAGRNAPSTN